MYSIEANQRHRLIHVAYHGTIDVAQRSSVMDAIATLSDRTGFTRLLLDYSDADAALDRFDASRALASKLTDTLLPRGIRVAFVPRAGGRTNQVVSLLAAARGLAIEPFAGVDEAIEWLLQETPGPQMHAVFREHRGRLHR